MKLTFAISAALMSAAAVHAAEPPPVARLYDSQLRIPESEVVPLAEAMPAEKYAFTPPAKAGEFAGVRTFMQQVTHIATTNYMVCGAVLQEKPDFEVGENENGSAKIKTKEQAVQYLKDSYSYCHKALQSLTAENQVELLPSPFGQGQMARGAIAAVPVWHSFDHYGQMVVYARWNGVIPPASRR
jgi:uncharacterized damage-inducible protein DinB